jgi:PAS domain S-box-containing protein
MPSSEGNLDARSRGGGTMDGWRRADRPVHRALPGAALVTDLVRPPSRLLGRFDSATSDAFAWALVNASPDGVLVVEQGGAIVLANRRAEALLGYERGGLLSATIEDLVPASLRACHQSHRQEFGAAPSTRPMGDGRHLRARRRDGSEVSLEISLSPMYEGSARLVIATLRPPRDMTWRDDQTRLRERERIGQRLVATLIRRLEDMALDLAGARNGPPDRLAQRCDEAVTRLDAAIHEIRTLVFDEDAEIDLH